VSLNCPPWIRKCLVVSGGSGSSGSGEGGGG